MKRFYYLGKDCGKSIRLFSVQERNNPIDSKYFDLEIFFPGRGLFKTGFSMGDLIKDVKESEYFRSSPLEGPHISIHFEPNKNSIFINRTSNIKQGCNFIGIKKGKLFVPVILKIFGQIGDKYMPKIRHLNKGQDIGINFDSSKDTLTMFFLISDIGVVFNKDPEYPANYFERDFKNFRLTVLYRFFNKPSEKMNVNFFLTSNNNNLLKGFEWWELCNQYNDLETAFVTEYFKKHPERNV